MSGWFQKYVTNPIFGDPAQGYKTAAKGAAQAHVGFGELSDRSWDRQMEGMWGAMGMTNPSATYAQSLASAPRGAMENAYGGIWQGYQTPGTMAGSYPGLHSALSGPSATGSTYQQGQYRLGGPTSQQSLAGSTQWGPTTSSQQYGQNAWQYNQPTSMQGFMGSTGSQLRAPGMFEQQAGGMAAQAQQPSYMARLYENNWGGYGTAGKTESFRAKDVNYAQDYAAGANQRMAGPTTTAQAAGGIGSYIQGAGFNGTEAGNLYRTAQMNDRAGQPYGAANDVGQLQSRIGGDMEKEGTLEAFANSYLQSGSNPYLDRMREQGVQRMNAEAAARGKFKSAGTLDRIGNYNAAMDAEAFKYAGDLAAQSQAAKMGRLGQRQGLAESASGETFRRGTGLQGLDQALAASQMGRAQGLHALEGDRSRASLGQAGALMGLAGQMEGEFQGRENALSRAAGMAGSEAMGNQQFALQASQAADNTRLARLAGMSGLAGAADTGNLSQLNAASGILQAGQGMGQDRIGMLGNFSGQLDAGQLARLQASQAAAGGVDSALMAQRGLQQNYAQGADSSSLAAMMGMGSLANQYDANSLARIGAQWGMGSDMDANSLARLSGLTNAANLTQQSERLRMGDAYDALYRSDALRSQLYGGFYQNAGNLYSDAQTAAWNALAQRYGLMGQGQAATAQVPFQIAGLGIEGYKASQGGR